MRVMLNHHESHRLTVVKVGRGGIEGLRGSI